MTFLNFWRGLTVSETADGRAPQSQAAQSFRNARENLGIFSRAGLSKVPRLPNCVVSGGFEWVVVGRAVII